MCCWKFDFFGVVCCLYLVVVLCVVCLLLNVLMVFKFVVVLFGVMPSSLFGVCYLGVKHQRGVIVLKDYT